MRKLLNKNNYSYYLVVLYFLTFAAILTLTTSCKTPSYAKHEHFKVAKCPDWTAKR